MKIKDFLRGHLTISYFVIAFLISWGGSILGGGKNFVQGKIPELIDILPMGIAMLLGPSFSGIVLTYIDNGRKGINYLFKRMKKWKINVRWYGATLIFPILILIILMPLSVLVTKELAPTFFPIGILIGLFAGFIEETGWMGFVYPKLRLRHGILRASIYLGILHAFWHIVADFLGNYRDFGTIWFLYFISFTVFIVALRIIIVWVYEKTKSLFLAQLMHASSSGFLSVFVPAGIAGEKWLVFYAVYAITLWIIASFIIIRNRGPFLKLPA